MNNQKHLTPEQVQELIELGVEFGETVDVWLRYPAKYDAPQDKEEWAYRRFSRYDIVAETNKINTTPAPNLQELIEVLPKYIEQIGCTLSVKFLPSYAHYKERTVFRYVDISNVTTVYFGDENPLIAATNLLKWVVENRPESLTKTENKCEK